MLTYMKYEIKGTYKFILGILALVFVLIAGLYGSMDQAREGSMGGALFTFLAMMILFGTALTAFLYIVGSFRKELYEDRGYLTFTLPLTGNAIIGSKLIVACGWFIVLGVSIALYNLLMVATLSPAEVNLFELFSMVFELFTITDIIAMVFIGILNGVNMLILIYFSMALSRVTFRNKRIGGLWFVIFLILSGILAFVQTQLSILFPYYLDMSTFSIETMEAAANQITFGHAGSDVQGVVTNFASTIFQIITTIALFLGTGYLIEKKIDL